jgi:hypothetical protein
MVFTAGISVNRQETLESLPAGISGAVFCLYSGYGGVWIAYRRVRKYDLTHQERINRQEDGLPEHLAVYCPLYVFNDVWICCLFHYRFHLKSAGRIAGCEVLPRFTPLQWGGRRGGAGIGRLYDTIKKRTGNRQAGLLTLAFIPAWQRRSSRF